MSVRHSIALGMTLTNGLNLHTPVQIVLFNYLLGQQFQMVQRLHATWMSNMGAPGMRPPPGMPMPPPGMMAPHPGAQVPPGKLGRGSAAFAQLSSLFSP